MFRATMGRALGFNGSSPPPPSPQIEIKSCAHFNFNSKAGLRACITRKGSDRNDERPDERTRLELDELCVRLRRARDTELFVVDTHEYTRERLEMGIFINTIILVLEIYIRCEIRHYLHFEQIAEKTDIKIYVDKA